MSRVPNLQQFEIVSQDGIPFTVMIDTCHLKKGALVISIAKRDPPEYWYDAEVVIETETSPDAARVLARIWDDETSKDGDATEVITLIEIETPANAKKPTPPSMTTEQQMARLIQAVDNVPLERGKRLH